MSQVMCALPLPSTFLAILVLSRNKRHIMESVKQVFTGKEVKNCDVSESNIREDSLRRTQATGLANI